MVRFLIYFIFTAFAADGSQVADEIGKLFIDGNKYRLEVEGELLVVCDGATQWMYKPQSDEIVIVGSEVASSLAKAKDMEEAAGSILDMLVPNAAPDDIVVVKDIRGVVQQIRISLGGKSLDKAKIDVTSAVEKSEFPQGCFTLNTADYPNAVVTDLR